MIIFKRGSVFLIGFDSDNWAVEVIDSTEEEFLGG
jgi:hypothetical protein